MDPHWTNIQVLTESLFGFVFEVLSWIRIRMKRMWIQRIESNSGNSTIFVSTCGGGFSCFIDNRVVLVKWLPVFSPP